MPRKVFTAGEVLAASDVNSFLMNQTVMVFAGTAARGSAIGTAVEGMYAHLNDTDTLTYYNGSAWVNRIPAAGILQVVSATKTDTFTTTSTTFGDVTGLSASITPSSATSKILVLASLASAMNVNTALHVRLMRDSTAISIGDAAGSRARVSTFGYTGANGELSQSINFLDSPASSSSLTYKIQALSTVSGQAIYVNRTTLDNDSAGFGRTASTITLMEVAG
jgi:hypothetical protein